MSFVVSWSYAWDYDDNQWEGTIAVGLFNGKITEEYYGFHQSKAGSGNPEEANTSQFCCHKPRSTQKQKGVSFSTASYYVPIFTKGRTTKNTTRQIVWGFGGYYFCLTGQVSWAIRNMY